MLISSVADKIYILQSIKLQYTVQKNWGTGANKDLLRQSLELAGTGSACISRKREQKVCRGVSSCFLYLSFGTVIVQGYLVIMNNIDGGVNQRE